MYGLKAPDFSRVPSLTSGHVTGKVVGQILNVLFSLRCNVGMFFSALKKSALKELNVFSEMSEHATYCSFFCCRCFNHIENTAKTKWTLKWTQIILTALQCTNTPSGRASPPVTKHVSQLNRTEYYYSVGQPVMLRCAPVWVNNAETKVFVYIMNLLKAAHIQRVHIWILYVCFLSLCSHRPVDIFLI